MSQTPDTVSSQKPRKQRRLYILVTLLGLALLVGAFVFWFSSSLSVSEIARFRDQSSTIVALHFSKDGKTLAIVNEDNMIQFWDVASKQLVRENGDYRLDKAVLTFNDDASTLYAYRVAGDDDGTIAIWDTASGTKTQEIFIDKIMRQAELVEAGGTLLGMSPHPSGRSLAIAFNLGPVISFDLEKETFVIIQKPKFGRLNHLCWSSDGNVLACFSSQGSWPGSGSAYVWHMQRPNAVGIPVFRLSDLCFVPNTHTLVTTSQVIEEPRSFCLNQWDADTGNKLDAFVASGPEYSKLACSPDGKYLAASGGETLANISIWDLKTGKRLKDFPAHRDRKSSDPYSMPYAPITALAFSPDGTTLASGCNDVSRDDRYGNAEVKLWKLK